MIKQLTCQGVTGFYDFARVKRSSAPVHIYSHQRRRPALRCQEVTCRIKPSFKMSSTSSEFSTVNPIRVRLSRTHSLADRHQLHHVIVPKDLCRQGSASAAEIDSRFAHSPHGFPHSAFCVLPSGLCIPRRPSRSLGREHIFKSVRRHQESPCHQCWQRSY